MITAKFRVWNKETNSFVDNIYEAYNGRLLEFNINSAGYLSIRTLEGTFGATNNSLKGYDCEYQMSTGLHDKNGKEIYCGDIVNKRYFNLSIYNGIGVVQMGEGSDSDGYSNGCWLGWMAGESSLLDVHSECEVIGNIYENPELLKN